MLATALAACLAFALAAVAHGADSSSPRQPGPQHVDETGCPTGPARPAYAAYDLGDSFAGLARTDSSQMCDEPPPGIGGDQHGEDSRGQSVKPPIAAAVPFTSVVYGDCQAQSEQGCAPPLEIQSWPQCERNLASYGDSPTDEQLNAHEAVRLGAAPNIPTQSFEDGTRIELYTGQTTIVVFADDPSLAQQAADALAGKATATNPSAHNLQAQAEDVHPSCEHGR